MRSTQKHDTVTNFIERRIYREVERLNVDCLVTGKATVSVVAKNGRKRRRNPNISVLDGAVRYSEFSTYSASKQLFLLVVEVVSTNWRDDYINKLDEYQRLGIPEYWIVDYLALASDKFLGRAKVPTVSIYLLVNGRYQVRQFRGKDRIVSILFPELELSVEQIVAASSPPQK